MTGPISTLYLARMHREDLLREAERQRLAAAARGSRLGLRQWILSGIGAAMIACGHRLQMRAPTTARAAQTAEAMALGERGNAVLATHR